MLKKTTLMLALIAGVLLSIIIYRDLTAEQPPAGVPWLRFVAYLLVVATIVCWGLVRSRNRKPEK